ncbi:MAG: PilN domain-containing protein [Flavobacteriaceae bacterium]
MLNTLRTYFKEGKKYNALEIHEVDGQRHFFLLRLEKKQGELVVLQKEALSSLDQASKNLDKKAPLFLIVNTAAVLTKMVGTSGKSQMDTIVMQAFPNLDLNNFYYQVSQATTKPIVALCKKEALDTLLGELRESGIVVSDIGLGMAALEHVTPYLERNAITCNSQRLQLDEGHIIAMGQAENQEVEALNINGLNLPSTHLNAFGAVLGHMGHVAPLTNFTDLTQQLQSQFKNARIFHMGLRMALGFFVVLLLANFLTYDHYREKVSEMGTLLNASNSQKEEVARLTEMVKRKEERLQTLSASSNSRSTQILDRLALTVPTSVLLGSVQYQPLIKKVMEKKPVLTLERTLLVTGTSRDMDDFSLWVENLENEDWVQTVETLDYDYLTKEVSQFTLEIEFYATGQEK